MLLQLLLLLLQRRRRIALWEDILLHQLVLLWAAVETLLEVVRDKLALELGLLGLQGRSRGGIEEDVSVLEILFFGAVLRFCQPVRLQFLDVRHACRCFSRLLRRSMGLMCVASTPTSLLSSAIASAYNLLLCW